MKVRIFFRAITSALAGFLFGFDTVVISGAEQQHIHALWGRLAGMFQFNIVFGILIAFASNALLQGTSSKTTHEL